MALRGRKVLTFKVYSQKSRFPALMKPAHCKATKIPFPAASRRGRCEKSWECLGLQATRQARGRGIGGVRKMCLECRGKGAKSKKAISRSVRAALVSLRIMSLHCLSLTAFSHGTVLRGGAPGRFCERRTRGRKQGKETGGDFALPLFCLNGDGHSRR